MGCADYLLKSIDCNEYDLIVPLPASVWQGPPVEAICKCVLLSLSGLQEIMFFKFYNKLKLRVRGGTGLLYLPLTCLGEQNE